MKQTNSSQYSHQVAHGDYRSRQTKPINPECKPSCFLDKLGVIGRDINPADTLRGYRTGLQRFYERYPNWSKLEDEMFIGSMK